MSQAPASSSSSQSLTHTRMGAIGLMCAGVTLFAVLDACTKILTVIYDLPISQVIWMRYTVHAVLLVMLYGWSRVPSLLRANQPVMQALRSLFMLSASIFNIWALQYLRLDQTVTIFFLAPLFVAVVAGPLLDEWVGWRRMIAILIGFGGILFVTRPGFIFGTGTMHWAFGLSFLAMASYASLNLITRYLHGRDDPHVTNFWSPIMGMVLSTPVALTQWVWTGQPVAWMLLFLIGFCGGYGHWLLIRAHANAPAPILSPFIYVGLITMTALGYLVFGDVPDAWTLLGAAIIIASGLYLLYRERAVDAQKP